MLWKVVDGWVSYKFWVAHQAGGATAFKCFKQPLERLLQASKSGKWTLSQSDASAETHKSWGSVNPSCATAGSCLSGVWYQILRPVPVSVLANVMHSAERRGGDLTVNPDGSLVFLFVLVYKDYKMNLQWLRLRQKKTTNLTVFASLLPKWIWLWSRHTRVCFSTQASAAQPAPASLWRSPYMTSLSAEVWSEPRGG